MEPVLRLSLSVDGDDVVVSLAGEIDLFSGKLVRGALAEIAGTRPRTVVDLREVAFIDSSGLSAITSAWRARDDTEGGSLVLGGPLQPMVSKILAATGLAETLVVVDRSDTEPGAGP